MHKMVKWKVYVIHILYCNEKWMNTQNELLGDRHAKNTSKNSQDWGAVSERHSSRKINQISHNRERKMKVNLPNVRLPTGEGKKKKSRRSLR
jgi:hypothetical protein